MTKYQVGDKVVVKTGLKPDWFTEYFMDGDTECENGVFFVEEMAHLAGQVVTIASIDEGQYSIDEDDGEYTWVDEFFEDFELKDVSSTDIDEHKLLDLFL